MPPPVFLIWVSLTLWTLDTLNRISKCRPIIRWSLFIPPKTSAFIASGMPMRLAIVNWNRRKIAGTENYLSSLIPELHSRGHSIALWHERDEPPGREQIELPDGSPSWCVAELGTERAL